ncbi:MAG: tripartite tricarboxylate transporter substrate binding protein [Rhizobiales bacterium]|nr:tripartite tricarboxylate transporter substrate binding protein [Hyphomicrobiales bacterium]
MSRTLKIALAVGLWLAPGGVAVAQDYPTQPVRFVVPYAAGGGTDAMARFFSKGLEQRLGQPFIVENRPGSGTTIGANFVAKSAPDGYTILLGTSSTFAIAVSLYKKLPYNPVTDFAPIALVAAAPFVLVVHPSLPVHSVADLVRYLKANRGFNYASGGVGSQHHVNGELFRAMAGLDIKNVSYRGGGPAVQDVVAGHVKMMFADVGGAAHGLIRDGKLRALAVTTARRVDTMPDIPTMHEAGITGYEANAWIAIVASAGTPASIVARLNTAFNDILLSGEAKAYFGRLGWQPLNTTPQELGEHIKTEIVRWGKVMQAAGAEGVE